ncbi:MAG TPA: hypothetical protein VFS31_10310 [Chitinophagaceae bacterium]|nr:hypothetical protein [Chitinophagaceae bacterium]
MTFGIADSRTGALLTNASAEIAGSTYKADSTGIITIPDGVVNEFAYNMVRLLAPGYNEFYTNAEELYDGAIFDLDPKPNYWPVGIKAVGIAALIAYLIYQAQKA